MKEEKQAISQRYKQSISEYYEQLDANKLNNLEEMDNIQEEIDSLNKRNTSSVIEMVMKNIPSKQKFTRDGLFGNSTKYFKR